MPLLLLYGMLAATFHAAAPALSGTLPGAWWSDPPMQGEGPGAPQDPLSSILDPGFPPTLYGLMEGNYTRDSARLLSIPGAGVSDLLSDESRMVGTGLGLNLGPGIKFQGFGVYDMEEGSTFAGPALKYDLPGGLDFTTGVQIPLNDRREIASGSSDFYFAEFRLLF
ncbi:MAG: hypothetical protein QY316_09495 [Thermodesulfobacteriota bacterium]|nr:MAG: hypothetical protein QY316_09495 [Thermodesulfobacteriota bacterium]